MSKAMKAMGIGDILDNTFSILRECFWGFQGVNFLSLYPVVIVLLPGAFFFTDALTNMGSIVMDRSFTGLSNSTGWGWIIYFIAFVIIVIRASINFTYGNINLFKTGLHGEFISATKAYKDVKGKRMRFVGASVITFLITLVWQLAMGALMGDSPHFVLTLLYYVGTFLISFFFCLLPVVLSMENRGVFASLKRAVTLLSGNRLRIMFTLFLVYLLVYILVFILIGLIIAPIILATRVSAGLGSVVGILLGIVFILAMSIFSSFAYGPLTAIYYDLLIRKEGYDIKQRLGSAASDLQSGTESL
ncbi:MAG TPA: hypothetical protein VIL66_08125 [Bacillota bacterium]